MSLSTIIWGIFLVIIFVPPVRSFVFNAIFPLLYKIYLSNFFFEYVFKPSLENYKGNLKFYDTPVGYIKGCIDGAIFPIYALRVLNDNYTYVIVDNESKQALVIDCCEDVLIRHFLKLKKLKLTHILTTHKHHDHSAGNILLKQYFSDELAFEVVGSPKDHIPNLTIPVKDQDTLTFFNDKLKMTVIATPCHTIGHVCFLFQSTAVVAADKDSSDVEQVKSAVTPAAAIFTGDCLFIGGCGRFFEGSGEMMHNTLTNMYDKVAELSPLDQTYMYCGHEYTVPNLTFARTIESGNENVHKKLEWAIERVRQGKPTVPSLLSEELLYNPFLRVESPEIQNAINVGLAHAELQTLMEAMQKRKKEFKNKEREKKQ